MWASDHFHPWFDTNGHGVFSWQVLSAIGAMTKNVILGTSITCPLFRYPPPIVAQAFATLASLCPGRVFLGVGSGEALNEIPCGFDWPPLAERFERLKEAIVLIRTLWNRSYVTYAGKYYKTSQANIYDKPSSPIPIHVASTGIRGAEIAGMLADSFMSLPLPDTSLFTNKLFPALDRGARIVGRRADQIEKSLLVHVGYSKNNHEKALESLSLWRATLLPIFFNKVVSDPRYIESHGKTVSREAVEKNFLVASTREDVIRFYENYIKLGFTHISASPSGDAEGFLRMLGQEVAPYIQETYGDPRSKSIPYRGTYTDENLVQYGNSVA